LSIESVNRALTGDRLIFLSLQNNNKEEPDAADIRPIGTIAAIRQMVKVPNGGVHIIVEGLSRARAELVTKSDASLRATVAPLPEAAEGSVEIDAYMRRCRSSSSARSRCRAACRRNCAAWWPGSTTRCGSCICSRACST
jgi:ATP-dependent Lon protease